MILLKKLKIQIITVFLFVLYQLVGLMENNVTVSGKIDGKFSWPPKGDFGFGYDPIFKPLGYNETFAEMDPQFKHSISHRALAFNKLKSLCFPSLEN